LFWLLLLPLLLLFLPCEVGGRRTKGGAADDGKGCLPQRAIMKGNTLFQSDLHQMLDASLSSHFN